MTDEQTYTWAEARKLQPGLPGFRRTDYWCRLGALPPQPTVVGSGHQRLWTRRQLRQLAAIQQTIDDLAGFRLTAVPTSLVRRAWVALNDTDFTVLNSGGVRIICQLTAEDGSEPIAASGRNPA